jgi:cell division protein FtsL
MVQRQAKQRPCFVVAEQVMVIAVIVIVIVVVVVVVVVTNVILLRKAVNGFVNLPPYRRKHHSTDQQCLKEHSELSAKNHLDLTHSEKVFLNFQTLGAATAKQ